jgi:uncharacterized protein
MLPADPVHPEALERLHPRAVVLFRVTTLARGAVLAGAVLLIESVLRPPVPYLLPTLLVTGAALLNGVLMPRLRYRAWGFDLREADLFLRYGVIVRTTSIVPHARVQHVDTRRGPLERWLGLAELVVYTAGTRGAIVSVPGLEVARAEALRDQLAALSGAGDAV